MITKNEILEHLDKLEEDCYAEFNGRNSISMIINRDTVAIPAIAYTDLCNLEFTYTDKGVERTTDAVYKSKDGHRVYLYLFCKDNTGSYEVTWIIQDKKYMRRVLDYGFM